MMQTFENILSNEFLIILIQSPSFWATVVWYSLLCILCLCILSILARKLFSSAQSLRNLSSDQSGAAAAVDFVLTIPIFTVVVMLIIQFALIAHAALIVHYSAYSAARSARVWLWDIDPYRVAGIPMTKAYKNPLLIKQNQKIFQPKIEQAARYALISAAPANGRVPCRGNCTSIPEKWLHQIAQTPGLSSSSDVFLRKARYAYDSGNSDINVLYGGELLKKYPNYINDYQQFSEAWPVGARVTFKYHLHLPVAGPVFGVMDNGFYYKEISAEVVLL